MKLKLLTLLLAMTLSYRSFSQNQKPELTINLLANDKITDVNLDEDAFVKSIQLLTDYFKQNFDGISETQKIGVLVIVHKSGKPTIQCYSNPKIDKDLEEKILRDIDEIQIGNTKIVDFPLFISINSPNKGKITDFEDYVDPVQKQYDDFKSADLKSKFEMIKSYAITEVLPVFSAYQVSVDKQFDGVKQFGKLVETANFSETQDMDKLINSNKNYWRATMEMNAVNQLIPATKICILAAQGEIDYAFKYLEIIRMFCDKNTKAYHYLNEMNFRISLFEQELEKQITQGIAKHDKGNYQNAINIYNQVLEIYPNSAWALYEKYYSQNAKNQSENKLDPSDRADWDVAKVEIYKHDPLYHLDVRASNGQEAYLIFRRQEISKLFEKENQRVKDLFKYAQISTDLGVYDFAAQLFWLCALHDKDNAINAINNFLYCLDKLGEKELKSNFKGDYGAIFKSIETEKEKEMKRSQIYRSMKN